MHQGDECSGSRFGLPLPPLKRPVGPETPLPFRRESVQAQRQAKPTSTMPAGEERRPGEIVLTFEKSVTFQTGFSYTRHDRHVHGRSELNQAIVNLDSGDTPLLPNP